MLTLFAFALTFLTGFTFVYRIDCGFNKIRLKGITPYIPISASSAFSSTI